MKTSPISLSLLLFCLFGVKLTTFAQLHIEVFENSYSEKQIAGLNQRKAIFILEDVESAEFAKRHSKTSLDFAKKKANEYNQNLKEVAKAVWKFNGEIEFKTKDEMVALAKTKTKDYCVIEMIRNFARDGVIWDQKFNSPEGNRKFAESWMPVYSSMCFYKIEDWKVSKPFLPFPHIIPLKEDIYTVLYLIQNSLTSDDLGDYGQLKEKTLLVPDDMIKPGTNLKGLYPYHFQILKKGMLTAYLERKDSNYVFLVGFPHAIPPENSSSTCTFAVLAVNDGKFVTILGNGDLKKNKNKWRSQLRLCPTFGYQLTNKDLKQIITN